MKVIVAGSRTINTFKVVEAAIHDSGFEVTEIVSGCARGVDTMAILYGEQYGIPIKRFPVTSYDWEKHGKSAGFIRNGEMARYADALVAVWDGQSSGTRNMIESARRLGLKVHIYNTGETLTTP